MNIITLGNCCKKSQKNHENAVVAAKNCGITEPVVNIGDMAEIMKKDWKWTYYTIDCEKLQDLLTFLGNTKCLRKK